MVLFVQMVPYLKNSTNKGQLVRIMGAPKLGFHFYTQTVITFYIPPLQEPDL